MLGSDDTSLYVVFMGTKHMRDVMADANLLQEPVWQDREQQVISTFLIFCTAWHSFTRMARIGEWAHSIGIILCTAQAAAGTL